MSGIVGSAGSKSGIITDHIALDYEQGVWTPSPNFGSGGSINTTSQKRYTKIGGMVWLECYFGNIQSPGFTSIGGLPFPTNPTGSAYENVSGTVMMHTVDVHADTYQMAPYIYNGDISFYQSRSGSAWLIKNAWDSGDDFFFSCHYMAIN